VTTVRMGNLINIQDKYAKLCFPTTLKKLGRLYFSINLKVQGQLLGVNICMCVLQYTHPSSSPLRHSYFGLFLWAKF